MIVDIDADLSPKLSTIKNLEALIKDGLAPFVREIEFNVTYKDDQNDEDGKDGLKDGQEGNQGDAEEEAVEEVPQWPSLTLSPEKTDYLRSLLAQVPNLKAVSIGTDQVAADGDETKQHMVLNFMFAQIFYAVSSLEDRNVVRLEMPVECLDQLLVLLRLDSRAARFEAFMQQLQHISLDNVTEQVTDNPRILEWAVLDVSPQLLSLEISDSCDLRSFNRGDRVHKTLQLKALNLSHMQLTSRDLLDLLLRSKDTLKYVSFEYLVLRQDSWLHVLIQIRKNLKLLELSFMRDSMECIEDSAELYFEDIPVPTLHLQHALGDIQRQINANRLEAGLEPFTTEIFEYLELRPLHAILPRDEWERLDSRTWEFVEDGNTE